ncbi:tyrosine-type recombinase/integrase [Desulfopila sp. IMCC35008]|uniref:tyrosine-type recombinase/integrase n=1 Tax=Desulfopila sp. IMCC35008 TaxID=2653858 RepID=UPI0013D5AD46|nr:tyrosine-type recombinase/integrase [Desulfopila sp. IMCC35008]
MSVRPHPKKGEGWWIIDYYPDGRKGKRVRFPLKGTKGEALAMEQDLRRSPGQVKNETSPLIKDLISPWLEYYKNEVAPSTYADARNSLAHWLPIFGYYKPANITQKSINDYKAVRLEHIYNEKAVERGEEPRYIKKRTINKELSYLSSCLKWAVQNGYSNELLFQIRGFPTKQIRTQKPIVLAARQMAKMYEVIEPEYKLLFLLMADMGLRREEALKATAEDVDEFHETLSVFGKGNKERILPWTTDRFAEELKKTLDKRQSGYLSINQRTGKRLVQIRKVFYRAGRNAGLNRDVNPHLLRHSCLTDLARKGMSPHALQQFAGHSSIETTNKIYVHIRSDYVGEEVRRLRRQR